MSFRRKMESKIDKKEQEIRDLEDRLREERAYLRALQDSLKLIPRDDDDDDDEQTTTGIRPGSLVAKALDCLRSAGKPMHVVDLLTAIGEETTREKRGAVSGSLSAYVRRNEIFTRPGPNTFGLIEWKEAGRPADPVSVDEPPDEFGEMR
jgi:hypothetical protein